MENHLFYRHVELAKKFILSFLEKDFTEKPKWTFSQPSIDICNQTYKAIYGSPCFIALSVIGRYKIHTALHISTPLWVTYELQWTGHGFRMAQYPTLR